MDVACDEQEKEWAAKEVQIHDGGGEGRRRRSSRRNRPEVEDALICILEKMPLQSIAKMQTVSRPWRSLLISDIFRQGWEQRHSRTVLMARERVGMAFELLAYDAAAQSWMSLNDRWRRRCLRKPTTEEPLAALLGDDDSRNVMRSGKWGEDTTPWKRLLVEQRLLVAGSSDVPGLLCFAIASGGEAVDILVANPLTGAHALLRRPKILLPPDDSYQFYLYLHSDGDPVAAGHYRIFLFYTRTYSWCIKILIYSSRLQSWCSGPDSFRFQQKSFVTKLRHLPPEEEDDRLFFHVGNSNVLAYSLMRDEWESAGNPKVPSIMSTPMVSGRALVFRHHQHRLLAAVPIEGAEYLAGFYVYELVTKSENGGVSGARWAVIARTPKHLWRGIYWRSCCQHKKQVHLVYAGGLVVMTFTHQPTFESVQPCGFAPALAFEIDANSWHHLPPPPPPEAASIQRKARSTGGAASAGTFRSSPSSWRYHAFAVCSMRLSFSASPWPASILDNDNCVSHSSSSSDKS